MLQNRSENKHSFHLCNNHKKRHQQIDSNNKINKYQHRILKALTVNINDLYASIDKNYKYNGKSLYNSSFELTTAKVLSSKVTGIQNFGHDNDEGNLVIYENEEISPQISTTFCVQPSFKSPITTLDIKHRSQLPLPPSPINNNERCYKVTRMLGQGSFGQVVECINKTTNLSVAVKIIKNIAVYNSQGLQELNILHTLQTHYNSLNYNIINVIDWFPYKNHLCLVFEKLDRSVLDVLRDSHYQGLRCIDIRKVVRQLLQSFSLLQMANVIHCDLKPENVLFVDHPGRSSAIRLIDLGSATYVENTRRYFYIQSRFYRAPEVLLHLSYGTSIDMWSLGCMIAEMCLGVPLFPGTSQFHQMYRIVLMLGNPPEAMLENGKSTLEYFKRDSNGSYTIKSPEEYAMEYQLPTHYPKKYFNLPQKLENITLESLILNYPINKRLKLSDEQSQQEKSLRPILLHFIKGLLNFDPNKRWTAAQALNHPFVTGESIEALNVFENKITCVKRMPPRTPRRWSQNKSASYSNILQTNDTNSKQSKNVSPQKNMLPATQATTTLGYFDLQSNFETSNKSLPPKPRVARFYSAGNVDPNMQRQNLSMAPVIQQQHSHLLPQQPKFNAQTTTTQQHKLPSPQPQIHTQQPMLNPNPMHQQQILQQQQQQQILQHQQQQQILQQQQQQQQILQQQQQQQQILQQQQQQQQILQQQIIQIPAIPKNPHIVPMPLQHQMQFNQKSMVPHQLPLGTPHHTPVISIVPNIRQPPPGFYNVPHRFSPQLMVNSSSPMVHSYPNRSYVPPIEQRVDDDISNSMYHRIPVPDSLAMDTTRSSSSLSSDSWDLQMFPLEVDGRVVTNNERRYETDSPLVNRTTPYSQYSRNYVPIQESSPNSRAIMRSYNSNSSTPINIRQGSTRKEPYLVQQGRSAPTVYYYDVESQQHTQYSSLDYRFRQSPVLNQPSVLNQSSTRSRSIGPPPGLEFVQPYEQQQKQRLQQHQQQQQHHQQWKPINQHQLYNSNHFTPVINTKARHSNNIPPHIGNQKHDTFNVV